MFLLADGPSELFQNFNDIIANFGNQYTFVGTALVILTIAYFMISTIFSAQIDNKIMRAEASIDNTNAKIKEIQEYEKKFNYLKNSYEALIANIEDANNSNSEDRRFKNAIPNLLNSIMTVIPNHVQLISIDNTTGTHVVIKAKTDNYEEIAFFKTKLKTDKILKNVVSDTGTTQDGYLTVTIEGELP